MANSTKRVNLYMSQELNDYYDELAKKIGLTKSAVMVQALFNYKVQIAASEMAAFAIESSKEKQLSS